MLVFKFIYRGVEVFNTYVERSLTAGAVVLLPGGHLGLAHYYMHVYRNSKGTSNKDFRAEN